MVGSKARVDHNSHFHPVLTGAESAQEIEIHTLLLSSFSLICLLVISMLISSRDESSKRLSKRSTFSDVDDDDDGDWWWQSETVVCLDYSVKACWGQSSAPASIPIGGHGLYVLNWVFCRVQQSTKESAESCLEVFLSDWTFFSDFFSATFIFSFCNRVWKCKIRNLQIRFVDFDFGWQICSG